jgi:hypothetical protein
MWLSTNGRQYGKNKIKKQIYPKAQQMTFLAMSFIHKIESSYRSPQTFYISSIAMQLPEFDRPLARTTANAETSPETDTSVSLKRVKSSS